MDTEKEEVLEFVDLKRGTITDVKTMEKRQLSDEEIKQITQEL
jgi:ssDNA-specific exonuclease RecJ